MRSVLKAVAVGLAAVVLAVPTGAPAFTVFSDSGANAAAITDTVDAFRAALGNPNNANNAGPLATGRREINWDGGGPPVIDGTAPVTPFTVFQNTRGATFTTPGTGLTQAAATGGLLSLDLINPQYAALFAPFSPNRLFAPIGSNITDGFFSIPGTGGTVPAGVRGFGVVFSDVDLAGTSLAFTTTTGATSQLPVATFLGNQTFSFLGAFLDPAEGLITSVRIITGTTALGPSESSTVDLVVMDDFLYGEPQQVPQPATLLLLALGLLAVSAVAWTARPRSCG
jgi:PEP-CTERM motif-containing protein